MGYSLSFNFQKLSGHHKEECLANREAALAHSFSSFYCAHSEELSRKKTFLEANGSSSDVELSESPV